MTEKYLFAVMPEPSAVELIHRHLKAYCNRGASLLLLRSENTKQQRGTDHTMENGAIVRWTDNSPAWEMHHAAYQGWHWSTSEFAEFLGGIPCEMFRIKNNAISKAGWYVAHIFPVKPDKRRATHLSHLERAGRFIRNVHPANHFYFPRPSRDVGRLYGERSEVIRYMAALYRERYAAIWPEFLQLAMARDFSSELIEHSEFLIDFPVNRGEVKLAKAVVSEITLKACHSGNRLGLEEVVSGRSSQTNLKGIKIDADPNQLCERIPGDCGEGDRNWVGNETSNRMQSGVVPGNAASISLGLSWKASEGSPEQFIGLYRLDLIGLEAAGYIRKEAKSGKYRIIIFQESDNYLYLQLTRRGRETRKSPIVLGHFA